MPNFYPSHSIYSTFSSELFDTATGNSWWWQLLIQLFAMVRKESKRMNWKERFGRWPLSHTFTQWPKARFMTPHFAHDACQWELLFSFPIVFVHLGKLLNVFSSPPLSLDPTLTNHFWSINSIVFTSHIWPATHGMEQLFTLVKNQRCRNVGPKFPIFKLICNSVTILILSNYSGCWEVVVLHFDPMLYITKHSRKKNYRVQVFHLCVLSLRKTDHHYSPLNACNPLLGIRAACSSVHEIHNFYDFITIKILCSFLLKPWIYFLQVFLLWETFFLNIIGIVSEHEGRRWSRGQYLLSQGLVALGKQTTHR